MNKKLVLIILLAFALAVVFVSCAGMPTKPTASNLKNPVIKLDSIQLAYYEYEDDGHIRSGFQAMSVYFLPDCDPMIPTGGIGGTNYTDLSDRPVLVK